MLHSETPTSSLTCLAIKLSPLCPFKLLLLLLLLLLEVQVQKMGKSGAVVCLTILAMDVIAGVLSFQAEINKNKVLNRLHRVECDEERGISETFKLGLAATLLLATAHIMANLLAGCMCFCNSMEKLETSSSNLQICFACLISSWITAAVGFPALIIGMLENSKSQGLCRNILHHHFLLIGGILCFVHSLFCIAFYVVLTISFGNQTTSGNNHHQLYP
ncbi:protein VASCULATURE COMPLEXITY AND CONNECTIVITY-like [Ziziphus jujuba]|uniref:Protein VASCULATURE COMPLEXITY AND CONNECTIVITY-like n=1 Tax=Ziziphus jujuba TaxID=326968 RepID=A0A6P6FUV2_ZIZJJ|nr:protein VASCULATURE COMPLEXITY AND CONNECTIVITY-like [Ziziphus jujuba]